MTAGDGSAVVPAGVLGGALVGAAAGLPRALVGLPAGVLGALTGAVAGVATAGVTRGAGCVAGGDCQRTVGPAQLRSSGLPRGANIARNETGDIIIVLIVRFALTAFPVARHHG